MNKLIAIAIAFLGWQYLTLTKGNSNLDFGIDRLLSDKLTSDPIQIVDTFP